MYISTVDVCIYICISQCMLNKETAVTNHILIHWLLFAKRSVTNISWLFRTNQILNIPWKCILFSLEWHTCFYLGKKALLYIRKGKLYSQCDTSVWMFTWMIANCLAIRSIFYTFVLAWIIIEYMVIFIN